METEIRKKDHPDQERKIDELSGIKALLEYLKERRQQRRLNLDNGC